MRTNVRWLMGGMLLVSLGGWTSVAVAEKAPKTPLKMCVDSSDWRPFVYSEGGQIVGVYADLMRDAAKSAGYKLELKPVPWESCLKLTQRGVFEGAVPASFKPERAEFMQYPDDAATNKDSKWALGKADYVLLVLNDNPYEYRGDAKTIPQPVYVPKGYSVGDDLRKQGLNVNSSASYDEINLYRMMMSGSGSAVVAGVAADVILEKDLYKGKFHVSETPVSTKTYFMPFAKESHLPAADVQKIWDQIARLRADRAWMRATMAKYQKD